MYCDIGTPIFEIVVMQLLNALNQTQLSYGFSRSDAYFVIDSSVKEVGQKSLHVSALKPLPYM
jgi:hypothetical protein